MTGYTQLGSIALSVIQHPVILKREYYSTGSIFGEQVTGSTTISTINGVIQPVSPSDIISEAGTLRVGDFFGFFHPEDAVAGSSMLESGSDYHKDFIQYPSGATFFDIVGGADEIVAGGSVFTSLILRRVVD